MKAHYFVVSSAGERMPDRPVPGRHPASGASLRHHRRISPARLSSAAELLVVVRKSYRLRDFGRVPLEPVVNLVIRPAIISLFSDAPRLDISYKFLYISKMRNVNHGL